ncbi:unnamed protein product [Phytophthora fragariaefolia]|uniref:Unnamed protein product n=1 Tax=Phytophthora fragariaefolia TaxID=1490495 RepID=A0A9W6XN22_9STRA|nr:unnamed protein product [Phytophthora fragariaefolia]
MLRPRPGSTQVRIVCLPERPDAQDEGRPMDSAGETDDLLERAEEDDGPECLDSHVQEDSDENNEIEDCLSQAMLGTPLYKLEQEYARCMRVNLEDLDLEPAVYIQEGSELMSQLWDELAMILELNNLSPECDITQADVGEPGRTTPDEDRKLRTVLEYHRKIFMGDGNASPAPARVVVCDLDSGDAKPVAQRPRSIAPHLMLKVYELLKKLLETKLIENSESPWASPIVIVLKTNGVDIRMCIDYRVVNGFIKLPNYPLPLIDDLLIGFETAMWLMSLGMVSGLWAVTMTERAKLIYAFRLVDPDVLEFLGLDVNERGESEREKSGINVPVLTDVMTVFQRNLPAPPQMGPVLGRSSYIDDIAHGAPTWDQLCADLDALLFRLRYWNITVGLSKSEFGKLTIPYLSHEISAEGLRATPKIAKSVQNLPFPKTLNRVQSFLGSLNYYHKFIEDFPVVAAVLYELTDEQVRAGRDLSRAKEAFEILKRKIVSTPLLRHLDRTKSYVIIPHANKWAACAVLGQECYGVIQPVRFTGRVLNDSEVRYHIAEKEVVAIMRVLEVFRTIVENCYIVVYTQYSVLSWLMKSKSADGRCVRWGLTLSHWDLEVRKVRRDEDGLAAILGAGITPREHLDEVAETLIAAKGRVKAPPVVSVEMLDDSYTGYVLSFDGAAKTSTRQGSCGCVVWELPDWRALSAHGFILEGVTVNDAEYHGLLKGMELTSERNVQDLVVAGASRIVIQQVQGLINSNQPNLQRRLAEYEALTVKFKSVKLVHVKRDYNQAADYLTFKTLALGKSRQVQDADELRHLEQVSKIPEKLMKSEASLNVPVHEESGQSPPDGAILNDDRPGPESAPLPTAARVMAAVVTRSRTQEEDDHGKPMGPLEYQAERWRRIKAHQESDLRSENLIKCLHGETDRFSRAQIRKLSKKVELFVVDERGVLFRLSRSTEDRPRDMTDELRLVVPEMLRLDIHYAHDDFQGRHQGVTRTFERRPFEVVSMDFGTHMPKSARGNTFLLLFQDMFSGYAMCKPMDSTTAQDVAEAYEERRPQANGQQERSVQTVIRSVRAYVAEVDQGDWGDHAERLMFALNTSFDATRLDTPFYLVHGWDAQGTVSAMLGPKPSNVPERTAYEWCRKFQRNYSYAQTCARGLQGKAKRERSAEQTRKWKELSERIRSGFEVGDAVWLFIPKVQTGLSPLFPERPADQIDVNEDDDFDAALLPEDSWEADNLNGEYEVEKIMDLRWSKRTRTSKRLHEYLVKWKGYDKPEWLPVTQLSCGALLYEFNQGAKARARFRAMPARDDHPGNYLPKREFLNVSDRRLCDMWKLNVDWR